MTAPALRQDKALRTGLAAWVALAVWQVVWHGLWQPATQVSPLWVTVACTLPLLLPLLAIRRPRRTLLLAGMLALFYFSYGIAEAWSVSGERIPALVEVLLCVVLIGALGAGVQRRRHPGVERIKAG